MLRARRFHDGPPRAVHHAAKKAVSVVLLGVLLCSLAGPALGIVSTTIAIDGDLADWTGVRADSANRVTDTQISDPDPDYPGQPDRDVYLVNATWDSQYLYLAFRRTSGGTKAITFAGYIDRAGDGLLHGNGGDTIGANDDVVVSWTVSSSKSGRFADAHGSSPSAHIFTYNQALQNGSLLHPAGDPMGHDGETPDGWADLQSGNVAPALPMDGWLAENGIEFEGRVAWSDLKVAPGNPISIHFVNGNGETFGVPNKPSNTRKWTGNPPQYLEENRGQVEDNVDGIWWLRYTGVSVDPDRSSGCAPGTTQIYTHTVTNQSNSSDTFDLTTLSSRGWAAQVTDTSGAPLSSVTLAAGASRQVQVRVTVPVGTPDGIQDETVLTAVSRRDATVKDSATDSTSVGLVTVTPEREGSIAPGYSIVYPFEVRNSLNQAGVFDLAAQSGLGFTSTVLNAAGNPITSVAVPAGSSVPVQVRVSAPATATIGLQDIMRLTARLRGAPDVEASTIARTTVLGPLTLAPSRVGFTGANTSISYTHTVVNSLSTTQTVNLTATSSRGWTVRFFATDGVTQITSVTLGPGGGSADVIARVFVPAGAATNLVDVTTVGATAGSNSATVTDTTTVRRLSVYPDDGYVTTVTEYELGDRVYARATGLSAGSKVTLRWYNAAGTLVRTSPERTVDTAGMAFDDYTVPLTAATGGWRVELYNSGGTLLETQPFTVRWSGAITQLSATDAPSVGSDVSITSSVRNDNTRAISNSTVQYTIWWDTNGDGSFSGGDTYIQADGSPATWNGSGTVTSHVTAGVDVAAGATWSEPTAWTVNNRLFPHQGSYHLTARWLESGGSLIDTKTTQFFSIPTLGPWPVLLGMMGAVAFVLSRRMRLAPGGGGAL